MIHEYVGTHKGIWFPCLAPSPLWFTYSRDSLELNLSPLDYRGVEYHPLFINNAVLQMQYIWCRWRFKTVNSIYLIFEPNLKFDSKAFWACHVTRTPKYNVKLLFPERPCPYKHQNTTRVQWRPFRKRYSIIQCKVAILRIRADSRNSSATFVIYLIISRDQKAFGHSGPNFDLWRKWSTSGRRLGL